MIDMTQFFSRTARIGASTSRMMGMLARLKSLLFCTLLMLAGAAHAGTVTVTTAFVPADGVRTVMDIGAVWNGSSVISPGNGDMVTFTLENTGSTSFDVKPNITIPTGFTVITSGQDCTTNPAR